MTKQSTEWHWLSERQTCHLCQQALNASGASAKPSSRRTLAPFAIELSLDGRLQDAHSASATRRSATRRRGMSLIEVMLATVLLLGAVMALSRLAFLARKHAISAEDRSMAQLYCQNITEELLAGTRPLRAVTPTLFEGGDWVYMIQIEPLDQANLTQVAVTVQRLDDPDATLPSEDEMDGYRLVRWMRSGKQRSDPSETLADPAESNAES